MGFCFINNVAVVAAHAIQEYGLSRVAIVDWDVHHGAIMLVTLKIDSLT
jgi:acetoin utilization deacetylase AcuC-like enzyme